MKIEIIATGTELLLGTTLNTHHQWLSAKLDELGLRPHRQVAVADSAESIAEAVRQALTSADLVITTGGLGPTSDDRTRESVASLFNRPLKEDPETVARIAQWFADRKRAAPERTRAQAMLPEGARPFPNHHGTAPGLLIEANPNPFRADGRPSWLIMLPGPPRELRPMFCDQVIPWLREQWPELNPEARVILRTAGMGESMVEEKLVPQLEPWTRRGLEIGYCARAGEVDVRLSVHGADAARILREAEQAARETLGNRVYGAGTSSLEETVIRGMTERKHRLAVAESCTGGLIAHRLTNVPGASAVFTAGLVTYSNEAKRALLGVPEDLLAAHGAVSEPIAAAMAEGVRDRCQSTFGLAVTGIAGPSGGTEAKPVGTVFIAIAGPAGTRVARFLNAYDRATFKQITSQQALDLARTESLRKASS